MRKKAHQLLKELALFSLASAATVFRVFPLWLQLAVNVENNTSKAATYKYNESIASHATFSQMLF
jgi:hypothetical protein